MIFCSKLSTSASPSGGLPVPRASISAFLREELIIRSVDTARSFLAFIASVRALLMSSRSTESPFSAISLGAAAAAPCLSHYNTQLRGHDPAEGRPRRRDLGRAQANRAFGAGRRNRTRRFRTGRDRTCCRRGLLQHRNDGL